MRRRFLLDDDGVRKRETRVRAYPYFFCRPKNGGLSADRPVGTIFTCRPSKQITAVVRMRRNDLHHSIAERGKLKEMRRLLILCDTRK